MFASVEGQSRGLGRVLRALVVLVLFVPTVGCMSGGRSYFECRHCAEALVWPQEWRAYSCPKCHRDNVKAWCPYCDKQGVWPGFGDAVDNLKCGRPFSIEFCPSCQKVNVQKRTFGGWTTCWSCSKTYFTCACTQCGTKLAADGVGLTRCASCRGVFTTGSGLGSLDTDPAVSTR